MSGRRAQRAARALADLDSDQFASLPVAKMLRATVNTVTAGGASDGNALVKVSWRNATLTVADYPSSYTPVVGHRVLCALVDDQLSILHRGIGYP